MKIRFTIVMLVFLFCFSFTTGTFAEGTTENGNNGLKSSIQTEMKTQVQQSDSTGSVIDKDKIISKSKQINPDKLIQKARDESVNWVYYGVIFFALLFVVGIFVRPVLKFASLFALSALIGYILLHDTDDVLAVMFSLIDKIEGFLTFK